MVCDVIQASVRVRPSGARGHFATIVHFPTMFSIANPLQWLFAPSAQKVMEREKIEVK